MKHDAATFRADLEQLLNRCSMENSSDTPDFVLAKYLQGCLDAFNVAVRERDRWHGHEPAETKARP